MGPREALFVKLLWPLIIIIRWTTKPENTWPYWITAQFNELYYCYPILFINSIMCTIAHFVSSSIYYSKTTWRLLTSQYILNIK